MKKPKMNHRLILIAFLVAVLLGGGSQAVAWWQQSSNLTMDVQFGNLPAPIITCESNKGQKIQARWGSEAGLTAFDVIVTQNGTPRSDITPTNQMIEIQFNSKGVEPRDKWVVSVTGKNDSGWRTETALYEFVTVPQGKKADLDCVVP